LPPLTPAERDQVIKQSAFYGHYEKVGIVNRRTRCSRRARRKPIKLGLQAAQTWQSEAGSLLEAAGKSAVRAMALRWAGKSFAECWIDLRFFDHAEKTVASACV